MRLALGQPELRLELAFDYHLKTFQSRSNTDNGEVSSQTIFHYRQQGSIVTAQYAGGGILEGQLIGTVDEAGVIQMHYQHLNTQKQLRTGRCQSTPERLPNGKIRLYENWQWTNGDQSSGHSVIEEV
nr:n-acetylglutamate synthase [Eisenibacter elegans]